MIFALADPWLAAVVAVATVSTMTTSKISQPPTMTPRMMTKTATIVAVAVCFFVASRRPSWCRINRVSCVRVYR